MIWIDKTSAVCYDGYPKYAVHQDITIIPHHVPRVYVKNPSISRQMKRITCEEFEQELREALTHLYDPDYQPSETFCTLVGCDPQGGALAGQTAAEILEQILSRQPDSQSK